MGYSDSNYSDTGSNFLERRDLLSNIVSSRQIIRDGKILINKPFLDEVIDQCMSEGRNRIALSIINRLLVILPSDSELLFKKTRCYLGLKQNRKAVSSISKALLIDPSNVDYLMAGGAASLTIGDPVTAEDYFQRVISLDRCDSAMYYQIGRIYSSSGFQSEAVGYYRNALTYNENYADAFFQLGISCEILKDYKQALIEYDRYLFIESNCAIGWFNRAIVLERLHRFTEAVESYQFSISLQDDFYEAQMNLGNLLAQIGRQDEAIACFNLVLETRPDNIAAMFNLGTLLEHKKDFASAVSYYTKCLNEKADLQSGFLGRGYCLLKLDRFEDALDDFRSAVMLDMPVIAKMKYDDKKLNKAMPTILKRIKILEKRIKQDIEKYLPKLVFYYILAKKYNEAIASVRKLYTTSEYKAESYIQLSMIYFSMGSSIMGYAALSQASSYGQGSWKQIQSSFPASAESKLFKNLFNFRK